MNLWWRMGNALRRIATKTSVIRTRADEAARVARDGGDCDAMMARVEVAVIGLETIADELDALA